MLVPVEGIVFHVSSSYHYRGHPQTCSIVIFGGHKIVEGMNWQEIYQYCCYVFVFVFFVLSVCNGNRTVGSRQAFNIHGDLICHMVLDKAVIIKVNFLPHGTASPSKMSDLYILTSTEWTLYATRRRVQ